MFQTLEILNSLAPNGIFTLVLSPDNSCYIEEQPEIFGKLVHNQENSCIIIWNHLKTPVYQAYEKIDSKKIVKKNYQIVCETKNKQINYNKYINLDSNLSYKTLAFYLPQFHEIEENNRAWGEGFTEWTNVAKSQPIFYGHNQPKIPSDFGFYNLEYDKKILEKQTSLARSIGINGFIFYYYRFNDKVILDKPIQNFLNNSDINLEFALCWANENWTKTWDGNNNDIILHQYYEKDYKKIIDDLLIYFVDKRYIKINNKPLFILYKPSDIPDLKDRISFWQEYIKSYGFDGLEIFVVNSPNYINSYITGNIVFAPTSTKLERSFCVQDQHIYDYKILVDSYKSLNNTDKNYPTVCPGWDNSSRRSQGASIFINDTQKHYCDWVAYATDQCLKTEHKILFVNAWNEWAEGAYLEPDINRGFQKSNCHLIVNKINSYNKQFKTNQIYNFSNQPNSAKIAYIIHGYYPDILEEFLYKIQATSEAYDLYISLPNQTSNTILTNILCSHPTANIIFVDNYGRDILPWITFNKLNNFDAYDCVCKLHTKKTLYNIESGNYVRNTSIKSLIGSSNIITDHINTLRDNKNIGMICPHTLKLSLQEWIGSNLKNIYKVYNKNIINLSKYYFCGGTMFWYKPQIFNGLLDILDEKYIIAENEPIGIDGNIVHAIERILGMYCIDKNFLIKETKL